MSSPEEVGDIATVKAADTTILRGTGSSTEGDDALKRKGIDEPTLQFVLARCNITSLNHDIITEVSPDILTVILKYLIIISTYRRSLPLHLRNGLTLIYLMQRAKLLILIRWRTWG